MPYITSDSDTYPLYSYVVPSLLKNSSLLAAGYGNGSVTLFDSNSCKVHSNMHLHSQAVTAVSFSPVNKFLLASGGLDGKVLFYDVDESNK